MVFISLTAFSPRKRLLALTFAILALSAVSCLADPILFPVKNTPYDRQMARIQTVLSTPASKRGGDLSLLLVDHWMGGLRAIPYRYSIEWKTPTELAHEPAGDCKAKAVALYQRMRENGAHDLRLVIGRRAGTSRSTHTWVEWTTASGTYVLDPTINWAAREANQIAEDSYVPYFAYTSSRKYRASAASSFYARL
jgi:hypothetical protein